MPKLRHFFMRLLVAITFGGLAPNYVQADQIRHSEWQLRLGASAIEFQLLAETPLGTSEAQVREYLRPYGVKISETWHGKIAAGSSYPPTSVGGDGFIRVTMGEYRLFFVTTVEAFYIFGPNGRLVDVKVRKSTDAL